MNSKSEVTSDVGTPLELRATINHYEEIVKSEMPFLTLVDELMTVQKRYREAGIENPEKETILQTTHIILEKMMPYLKEHGVSEKKLRKNSVVVDLENNVFITDLGITLDPLVADAEKKVMTYNALAVMYTLDCIELDAVIDPILEERALSLEHTINSIQGQMSYNTKKRESIDDKIALRKSEVYDGVITDCFKDWKKAVESQTRENTEYNSILEKNQNLFNNIKVLIGAEFKEADIKSIFLWDTLDDGSKKKLGFFTKDAVLKYNGLNEAMNQLRKEGGKKGVDVDSFHKVYRAAKTDLKVYKKVEKTREAVIRKQEEIADYLNNGFKDDSSVTSKYRAIARYETILKKMTDKLMDAKSEHQAIVSYLKAHEL